MTSLQEQVALIQQQIDSLTEQVLILANQKTKESLQEDRAAQPEPEVGINRFRKLHGKA